MFARNDNGTRTISQIFLHLVSFPPGKFSAILRLNMRRGFSLYYLLRFGVPIFIFAVVFGGGYILGVRNSIPAVSGIMAGLEEAPSDAPEWAPFWKAWGVLNSKFVGSSTPSGEERLWGAIEGLASSYNDPFTVFLPPVESKNFTDEISGSFEGVGMEIGTKDGVLSVISPLKNSPAERAGILPADKIIKIDGEDSLKMAVEAAVKRIRGKAGTTVTLDVIHQDSTKSVEISIVREAIVIPATKTELRSDGVFVISLYSFSAPSPGEFRNALREFAESGASTLLLDLRNNPGGYLEAAVDMGSWFLPLGKPIVREDFGSKRDPEIYRSKGYDVFTEHLTLGILMNGGSASASEILAGALRDHGKAVLIGEKSFGKGSVQELVSVTDNTYLKVTIARWLTPSGTSISAFGLTPDLEIKMTEENLKTIRNGGKDAQLEGAIRHLLEKAKDKNPIVSCVLEGNTLACP